MNNGIVGFVLCERRETFALVNIDRPAKHNALNLATIQELMRVFSGLRNEPEVRVVILTGSGEQAFSAGADIEEISDLTPEVATERARAGQALTTLIEDLGKPVIGAINGLAYGGGCELALVCTWRIATTNATFAQPEIKLGLMPAWGGLTRLSRLIGKSRALELILTGEPITAEEALRIGLVNRLVRDRGELMAVCEDLAREVSYNSPLAVKYALEAVNHGFEMTRDEGLRLESALFGLCFATEDVKEGVQAFREKRQPNFERRRNK